MRGLARAAKRAGEMAFNAGGGAVNWFPGHMAAASRAIRDRLKLADLVLEVRDARVSAPRFPFACCYSSVFPYHPVLEESHVVAAGGGGRFLTF